jgi:cytochrome c
MIMRSVSRWFSVAAWVFALGTPADSQEAGDLAAGRQIAKQWCSECHQIDDKEPRTESDTGAPSFPDVASTASTTALSLKVFFRSSHVDMPDFHISPAEADDLAAYILSLKRK